LKIISIYKNAYAYIVYILRPGDWYRRHQNAIGSRLSPNIFSEFRYFQVSINLSTDCNSQTQTLHCHTKDHIARIACHQIDVTSLFICQRKLK